MNAHNFIKITIILQHTSFYMLRASLAHHQRAHSCTKKDKQTQIAKAFSFLSFYLLFFSSHFTLFLSHLYYSFKMIKPKEFCNIIMHSFQLYYSVLWNNIVLLCTTVNTGLSPFIFFLCIWLLPDDGCSGQPKHVVVYNKRLMY